MGNGGRGSFVAAGEAGRLIGLTLGDYTLNALVGIGGMAEVYRAHDSVLGRAVAVKVLSPQGADNANYRELFRKEARRVAALDHPNIVPVYYLGEQDGLLFLVMPLMAESLRQRIERAGRPTPYEAVRVIVQIAAALFVAHQAGIIHRDVKPENILLNVEGRPLLTDFGIARDGKTTRDLSGALDDALAVPRRPSATLAREGLPVGTPEYMAPEQLRLGIVDRRVDIYALGAVLYELLTGRAPHEAPTPEEVAALTLSAPVVPPSTYNPAIWPDLEVAVLTALAYDPSDRFPDAREFAMSLLATVEGHPEQRAARITPPQFVPSAPDMLRSSTQDRPSPPLQPALSDTEPTIRVAVPPRGIGRARLLLFALIVLTVAAVVIGSGFLFFGGSSSSPGSISATETPSSSAYYQTPGNAGTPGTAGPGATGTPRHIIAFPGPPKTTLKPPPPPAATPAPTATKVPTATATSAATSTATGTVGPTDTPAPTATATQVVQPQLTFNPASTLALTDIGMCLKQDAQTISNPGSQTRTWSWSVSSTSSDTLWWSPTGLQGSWNDAVADPPTNVTTPPNGGTSSIYVLVDTTIYDGMGTPTANCNTTDASSWSITLTDDLNNTYMFTAELQ